MRARFILTSLLFSFCAFSQKKNDLELTDQQKLVKNSAFEGNLLTISDTSKGRSEIRKIIPFVVYNLSAGMLYGHSIGGGIKIQKKHEVSAEIVAFVPQVPFKERWFFGQYLSYSIFPFKPQNSVKFFFSCEFANNRYGFSGTDVTQNNLRVKVSYNDIYGLIGPGSEIKICRNLMFQTSIHLYLAEFDIERDNFDGSASVTSHRFYLNKFEDFRPAYSKYDARNIIVDMLLFKAGLKYRFGK